MIGHIGSHHRLRFASQQTVVFELFEVLDQDFFADSRDGFSELAIPLAARLEMVKDNGLPITADFFEDPGDRAFGKGELLVFLSRRAFLDMCHCTYFRVSTCLKVSTNIPLFPTNTKSQK